MINNLIIFDGECGFCNYYINLLISWDKKSIFKFSSFDSELSKESLQKFAYDSSFRDSVVLVMDGNLYTKSSAILKIFSEIGPFWNILGSTLKFLLPKAFRDYIYDLVATNRYIISRNYNSCKIPEGGDRDRFV